MPFRIALPLLALTGAFALHAQTPHDGHHPSTTAAQSAPGAPPSSGTALPWAEAEVRRVDNAAAKVTLRHGEIRNLDMPPMTMVFQVRDPSLLRDIRAGDKVRFTAEQVNGAYTVMALEPLR